MRRPILILFVIVFYWWTASVGDFRFSPEKSFYRSLSQGFLKGQLYLPINPGPELLEHVNPYRFGEDYNLSVASYNDLSLYKGKLYMYFGPTPALTLFIPWSLLSNIEMTDHLAAFIFLSISFLFSILLLLLLSNSYFPNAPPWTVDLTIAVLGFGNLFAYILRRPIVYEVAIACASLFLTLAIYFLFRARLEGSKKMLFLASFMFGLMIGSRAHLFLVGAVMLSFYFFKVKCDYLKSNKEKAIVLFTPFMVCQLCLLLYNYLRFDSFFENGYSYQIAYVGDWLRINASEKVNPLTLLAGYKVALSSAVDYLFTLPLITSEFPFFYVEKWNNPHGFFERVVGIFPGIPFLIALFFAPYNSVKAFLVKNEKKSNFPVIEFITLMIPGIVVFFVLIFIRYVSMRQVVDFLPLLIIAAWTVWMYFIQISNEVSGRKLKKIFILVSTITIIFGMSYSITGCYHGLKDENPQQFEMLSNFFTF